MIYKCATINCKSGYSSEEKKFNITYLSFPLKDEELLCNWLKNIARKNLNPQNTQSCAHFILNQTILLKFFLIQTKDTKEKKKVSTYVKTKTWCCSYDFQKYSFVLYE